LIFAVFGREIFVGFFWLSWRIANKAVGFFWLFCGIFLVILWDFSGYFVGFFWLSWRIVSHRRVSDADGKNFQTRVRYEFVLFMHFTTHFTIQLWSIGNPTHPKDRHQKSGSRIASFSSLPLGSIAWPTDHGCIVKHVVKCINNANSYLTRV